MSPRVNADGRRTRPSAGGRPFLLGVVLAVAAWVLVLGWHATKHVGEDGYATGPYSGGEVLALCAGLACLVLVAESRREHLVGPGVLVGLVTVFSADAATVEDPLSTGASLWPLGAVMIAIGGALALLVLRAAARPFRRPDA